MHMKDKTGTTADIKIKKKEQYRIALNSIRNIACTIEIPTTIEIVGTTKDGNDLKYSITGKELNELLQKIEAIKKLTFI